eukprot:gnl/MRDRNA2_/MRDRNA2_44674_c0_seq1.p2 gnl/MRDRNA2_/MRDRNA2_44674_c0~~gnl/MRDRNA2_/MRDRNA2_44674_c0_seq1.p2  ORF type:complete len:119 (+),score=12.15 gnl/MRDRNA2_/MRDRNA2_44674_c0_seq1:50-406(+)
MSKDRCAKSEEFKARARASVLSWVGAPSNSGKTDAMSQLRNELDLARSEMALFRSESNTPALMSAHSSFERDSGPLRLLDASAQPQPQPQPLQDWWPSQSIGLELGSSAAAASLMGFL